MSINITIQTTIHSNIQTVWSAWTTPEDINQWNFASIEWCNPKSTNDLIVGGRFNYRMEAKDASMGFDFEGTYTNIIYNELIEYKLDDNRLVKVEFIIEGDQVIVKESFDCEDENTAEQQKMGWQCILDNFKKHVESK
ncbi:SRPBCC family protein [Marinicellulosiphila megalodicopiae]|uniref:SRPBCC family protein n=1 Tax=Marinicellulosiphila megalodicopiae TaxID=2724896 RepID=UPI003BB05C86